MAEKGGKRGRKVGNKARKQSFKRYWAPCYGSIEGAPKERFENRRALHKARRVARFQRRLLDSEARQAARIVLERLRGTE